MPGTNRWSRARDPPGVTVTLGRASRPLLTGTTAEPRTVLALFAGRITPAERPVSPHG